MLISGGFTPDLSLGDPSPLKHPLPPNTKADVEITKTQLTDQLTNPSFSFFSIFSYTFSPVFQKCLLNHTAFPTPTDIGLAAKEDEDEDECGAHGEFQAALFGLSKNVRAVHQTSPE